MGNNEMDIKTVKRFEIDFIQEDIVNQILAKATHVRGRLKVPNEPPRKATKKDILPFIRKYEESLNCIEEFNQRKNQCFVFHAIENDSGEVKQTEQIWFDVDDETIDKLRKLGDKRQIFVNIVPTEEHMQKWLEGTLFEDVLNDKRRYSDYKEDKDNDEDREDEEEGQSGFFL